MLHSTKYARLAEITAPDSSIAVTLAAHQAIGLKVRHHEKPHLKAYYKAGVKVFRIIAEFTILK